MPASNVYKKITNYTVFKMKSVVQHLREEKNLTQTELAEKSELSLRTIQRIEAGNVPKGFTLKAIANALDVAPEKLMQISKPENVDRAKFINLSALMGLIIPFGGIIFPLILTYKTNDPKNKELGKSIVSLQILLASMLSIALILSPFLQKELSLGFPVFIILLLIFISLKILVVILNGINLNKKSDLYKRFKINYL